MSTTINGTNLVLLATVGSSLKPFAHATSHSLDIESGTRDTSSKDSGDWTEAEATRLSFSGSADGLVSYDAEVGLPELLELVVAKEKIDIACTLLKSGTTNIPNPGSKVFSGKVILTGVSLSSPDADNATYNISFQGTGPLLPTTPTGQ